MPKPENIEPHKTKRMAKAINNTPAKKQEMIEALTANFGVVATAAKRVGINRDLHYRWMIEDDNYRKAVEDIRGLLLDFAESKLYELINKGNIAAILFTLKTKGKDRGWIEKIEVATNRNKEEKKDSVMRFRKIS